MPGIPITSKAVEASVAAQKVTIPTGKQLLSGGAKFGGTISAPAAIGAGVILGVTEGLFPRRTVAEADEQRAIRQAEATRQWRKEQREKANKNPNLDYLPNSQSVGTIETGWNSNGVVGTYRVLGEYQNQNTAHSGSTLYFATQDIYGEIVSASPVAGAGQIKVTVRDPNNGNLNDINLTAYHRLSEGSISATGKFIVYSDSVVHNDTFYYGKNFKITELRNLYDVQNSGTNQTEVYSEATPTFPAAQPLPSSNLIGISSPSPQALAKKLAGLIRSGEIDDAQTTPEARAELQKLIASENAITSKTNVVVDDLYNGDGYASAYSDGYSDGISASLEQDRLKTQNKANNLDVAIPKPSASTQAKQKPTAVTATSNIVTQEKTKEPTITTKTYVAGSTPIKETTITDNNTGIKVTTAAHAETGKTISIKRTIPAGVTVTNTGVNNAPIASTPTTSYKFVGTPSNTGTGVTPIPQVPTVEQAPTIPQIAGGALTTAAIAAAVYSEQGVETLTSAAAAGTCRTTQPGGCMQNNVVDPIKAGQTSLGELINAGISTGLAAQNAAIQAIVTSTNDIVKNTTYGLEAAHNFTSQAWQSLRINKILDYLNTVLILHNAAMLSTNLAGSLGDILSMIANNTINLIKNEDGSNIDINQTLGNTIEGFLTSILGAENYQNASTTFHRASRIVNSAANILNTIQFSLAGMAQGLETVGQYTGKIGNALKSGGAVLESSYQWMSEKLTVKTGKLGQIQAVIDGLEQVENIASDLESVTSEFREVQDNVSQIGAEFNKIKTEVSEKETEKASQKANSKTNSQGSQPNFSDYTPDPLS